MTFERTYTIPLRQEILKAPHGKRAKKAITALKEFAVKHGKSEDVSISEALNEYMWTQGMQNPPTKVTVTMKKDKDGHIAVDLVKKA